MGPSELDYSKEEIKYLLKKGLIKPYRSPWAYRAFYVNKN